MNITPESNGGGDENKDIFDLEEQHEAELRPLILELCKKADKIGAPIFVTVCYKADGKGAWFASSSRTRENFIPNEFRIMRAIVEGELKMLSIPIET